jgi:sirohydrochlorin cobaltochelatase
MAIGFIIQFAPVMENCIILVGHGGVPTDCPPELVSEFKRQEALARRGPAPGLKEADEKLRRWPRTPKTDPYQTGLEAVAESLRRALPGRVVLPAYNEFCAPSLEDALADAVGRGARAITVISTMYTRGGIHSETEIPEILASFRAAHPKVDIRYCWPFDLEAIGAMLAAEVTRAETKAEAK